MKIELMFNPKDHFKVGNNARHQVRIASVSERFIQLFGGKKEKFHPHRPIYGYSVEEVSGIDTHVLEQLAGREGTPVTLQDLWWKLKNPFELSSNMHTNGQANIFYIEDVNGEIQPVMVRRTRKGWKIDVRIFDEEGGRREGDLVFSAATESNSERIAV